MAATHKAPHCELLRRIPSDACDITPYTTDAAMQPYEQFMGVNPRLLNELRAVKDAVRALCDNVHRIVSRNGGVQDAARTEILQCISGIRRAVQVDSAYVVDTDDTDGPQFAKYRTYQDVVQDLSRVLAQDHGSLEDAVSYLGFPDGDVFEPGGEYQMSAYRATVLSIGKQLEMVSDEWCEQLCHDTKQYLERCVDAQADVSDCEDDIELMARDIQDTKDGKFNSSAAQALADEYADKHDKYDTVVYDAIKEAWTSNARLAAVSKDQMPSIRSSRDAQDAFYEACAAGLAYGSAGMYGCTLPSVDTALEWRGELRVNVHANQSAGLRVACWANHPDVIDLLLDAVASRTARVRDCSDGAFRGAYLNKNIDVCWSLLSKYPAQDTMICGRKRGYWSLKSFAKKHGKAAAVAHCHEAIVWGVRRNLVVARRMHLRATKSK